MTPFRILTGTYTRDIWEGSFLAYQQKVHEKNTFQGEDQNKEADNLQSVQTGLY